MVLLSIKIDHYDFDCTAELFTIHDSVFCSLFKIRLFRFFVERTAKPGIINQEVFTRYPPFQILVFKP